MQRFIILLFAFIPLIGSGQSNINQANDTIIHYDQDTQNYVLKLTEKNQTIYFDSLIYDNSRPINILIKNNTADTITITYKSLISSKVVFKENSSRYIKPNEYYSLSPIFNNQRYTESSLLSIHSHFTFSYSVNNQPIQFIFRLKGYIVLDSLPEFNSFKKNNFSVVTDSVPIKEYQKSISSNEYKSKNKNTEKISDFKYQKELWIYVFKIYPMTLENILPANLAMKYEIKGQDFYAEKRMDSHNKVYFVIPSQVGDTIYCILSSPEYGYIYKQTYIREETNKTGFSFSLGAELNEPHYYNHSGNRVVINKSLIGHYYIPRDYSNQDYSRRRIDSLNTLIKKYNAFLNYGLDGFTLKCNPKQAFEIKNKLGNPDLYQLIEERIWITDYYDIFFEPKLSKENIKEILNLYGITDFYVNYKEHRNNEWTNSISKVTIKLDNVLGNNTNNQLINKLLVQKEILKIVQQTIHFTDE